ncbi:ATP-binding protein [Nitrosomonas sp. ANs5]|uniref:sensor histidine kinase n=1 Tax=Nitrosomonas sp. ANs5 TaxID=3423941 RepID=UPI003D357ECA
MARIVAILMVGHTDEAAGRVRERLGQDGLLVTVRCVAAPENLMDVLQERAWDVVLTDDRPDMRAEQVLALVSRQVMDIPVVALVSHDDDLAAARLLMAGARDFLLTSSLTRLTPAIRYCLQQHERLQDFHATQLALEKSEIRFRAIASNLPGLVFQCVLEADGEIAFPYVSEGCKALLGLAPDILRARPAKFAELILAEDVAGYRQSMQASARHFVAWNWEGRIQAQGDTDIKWISLRATPRRAPHGGVLWEGIMLNITRNKQTEIEIAHSRAQLAELVAYSQKAKEQERARIAREIHDEIGGILTAIKCELVPCMDNSERAAAFYRNKAAAIETLIDMVIDSTRRIALDLRPGILDCGILPAVRWQAREFSKHTGVACFVVCESEEIALDGDLAVAVFRIFQEALTNVARHAGASEVRVRLAETAGCMYLEVADNGRGITRPELEKVESFGIKGMRERCQQLGGRFHIQGQPKAGTEVMIWIPVESRASCPPEMPAE